MKRRNLLLGSACLAMLPIASRSGLIHAQSKSAPTKGAKASMMKPMMAVNVSGKQRTLTLRAARTYAQLGLGVLPQRSSPALQDSIASFDEALRGLAEFTKGKSSAATVARQATEWARLREMLREAPSLEGASALNLQLEKVIPLCTEAHDQIVAEIANPAADTIRRTGRQRFLSQRAGQLFMFREWGVARGSFNDIEALNAESRKIREDLRRIPDLSPDVRRELDLAEGQWVFFDEGLRAQQRGKADDVARRNVATTSERILEIFDKLTLQVVAQYES